MEAQPGRMELQRTAVARDIGATYWRRRSVPFSGTKDSEVDGNGQPDRVRPGVEPERCSAGPSNGHRRDGRPLAGDLTASSLRAPARAQARQPPAGTSSERTRCPAAEFAFQQPARMPNGPRPTAASFRRTRRLIRSPRLGPAAPPPRTDRYLRGGDGRGSSRSAHRRPRRGPAAPVDGHAAVGGDRNLRSPAANYYAICPSAHNGVCELGTVT